MISKTRSHLRVMHLVAPAKTGGIESVIRQLATGHRQLGVDVSVAAILARGGEDDHEFVRALREAGIPVFPIGTSAREVLDERRTVRDLLAQEQITVAHLHGYRPELVDAPIARSLRIPTVSTLHGFVGGSIKGQLYEWLYMRATRRSTKVVAVSEPIAARLNRAGERRHVSVIPNAVASPTGLMERKEARAYFGMHEDAFTVGWVGRLSREKGADVFLGALAETESSVRAIIVGDGPERAALERACERLGLRDRVKFVGLVPEASRYLAAFDALALSSRTEGTPMVILEAMWAKVPIVATAVGGIPYVLGSDSAALCPPDDPHAFAVAIDRLVANPSHARMLATCAHERVGREHSYSRWLERYLEVYEDTLSQV